MIKLKDLRALLVISGVALAAIVVAFAFHAGSARADEAPVPGGSLDWGIKTSFVSYIQGSIAHGEITTEGVTTNADGSYRFPLAEGTTDTQTGATSASFTGSVHFTGHDEGTGPQLDLLITNIRIDVSGVQGTVVADVTSKGLGQTDATDYPDVVFATLDFSMTPPAFEGSSIVFHNVPTLLTADGAEAFAGFYDEGTELDPLTVSFELGGAPTGSETPSPSTTAEPTATPAPAGNPATVSVSKTTVDPDGDTITVTGSGFLPSLATGTRPPLTGMPSGTYVVFGAFADTWAPSAGAAPSARPAYGDGGILWAVPESSRDSVGRNASVTLNADGTFTAVLKVKRGYDGALADGNYGIYTYAGGGAVQPLFETFTPITFTTAPAPPATGTGLAGGGNTETWLLLLGALLLGGSGVLALAVARSR